MSSAAISGLREQIMANASLLYPQAHVVYGAQPIRPEGFEIVLRHHGHPNQHYKAVLIYSAIPHSRLPQRQLAAEGKWASGSYVEALESLLETLIIASGNMVDEVVRYSGAMEGCGEGVVNRDVLVVRNV